MCGKNHEVSQEGGCSNITCTYLASRQLFSDLNDLQDAYLVIGVEESLGSPWSSDNVH